MVPFIHIYEFCNDSFNYCLLLKDGVGNLFEIANVQIWGFDMGIGNPTESINVLVHSLVKFNFKFTSNIFVFTCMLSCVQLL